MYVGTYVRTYVHSTYKHSVHTYVLGHCLFHTRDATGFPLFQQTQYPPPTELQWMDTYMHIQYLPANRNKLYSEYSLIPHNSFSKNMVD